MESDKKARGHVERLIRRLCSEWEFTKLLTQILKIFLNFKVLLRSSYSWKIAIL